ncbi:TPA: hypothetical protein ACRRXZ_000247 [Morganella morganii]
MKKRILTAVLLFSGVFLAGCDEKTPPAEQYYIVSDFNIQLFDDKPADEYAGIVSNIKKSGDNTYLRALPDKSLTWYTHRTENVIHPDNDGYYTIDINRFRFNNANPDKPQLIFDKNSACIRECAITMTLKPVAEDSNEIRLIKAKYAMLTVLLSAGYLSQADAFIQYPQAGFNGRHVNIGWPDISPHSLKLNFSDTLTEIKPDDDDDIKTYFSWFNLPYQPDNIRAYHYTGSRYHKGVIIAVKDSDPVTDLQPVIKKMNATVFDEGQGAVFYSDTESLTGLYYYYDAPARVLYLAVLSDGFRAVSDSFLRDYTVIRTLNPDNAGIMVQESDLAADSATFEKKFKSPLNDDSDKDSLAGIVTDKVNNAIVSPEFFFRYPENATNGRIGISLSRLSGFFTDNPVTVFATLHKATVAELLTELKKEYPQGRIYRDVFINDSPPVFYFLGETNTGLTLKYTFQSENDTGNDLMTQVIIAQLLRQISPLQLSPVDPVRLTHFQQYQMDERYMSPGYRTTEDNEFISFNSLLLRADTGEVIIRNPPENHTVYTRENGLIQARDANLKHDGDTLRLYTGKGEFIVSGRRFEFNDEGNAVTVTQCCGTGVFDLNRRKWLVEPKFAYIADYNGFYIAKVHFRQPAKVIFNHRGDILGYGTSIITSAKNRQILIFDGTIDSGRWLNDDGTASENPVVTEAITLQQGTFYIIRMDDRIMLLNERADVIIPAFDYSKYKTGKTGLWLWSVREDKWVQPDLDRIFRNLYG